MHTPVLLQECIDSLKIKKNGIYIDGTFGRGGHSKKILENLNEDGHLISFDKDIEAIEYGKKEFLDSRFDIIHSNFSEIKDYCKKRKLLGKVDGILLDLGLCSTQIDRPIRGFSFYKDGPLDMRMNQKEGISAKEAIIRLNEQKLSEIFYYYGGERFSRKIAEKIKYELSKGKIFDTTSSLSNLISSVVPRREKIHPATRIFQALRIYINSEILELKKILNDVVKILKVSGRFTVISFHSLEHRIIKKILQTFVTGKESHRRLPYTQAFQASVQWIFKKKQPSYKEKKANTRSRSAVLRTVEKTNDSFSQRKIDS